METLTELRNRIQEFDEECRACEHTDTGDAWDLFNLLQNELNHHIDAGEWYVNLYAVERVLGGPEEGGWYYDRGTYVESIPTICGIFRTKEEAAISAKSFNDHPGDSHLTAIHESHQGQNYPLRTPWYE